jgi:hypothetical protein
MAEKECSQCKENLNSIQTGMLILSIYVLVASIYGTIKLFELVTSYF